MGNSNKINVTKWSPKVRYGKTSTCRLNVPGKDGVSFELGSTPDKKLNTVLIDSVLTVTPDKTAPKKNTLTINAKENGKTIASETIQVNVAKSLAVPLGLGLGLGIPVAAGVAAGIAYGVIASKKDDGKKIGKYIVSDPVNCTVSEEDGELVIKVTDPTKPASVKVTYDGDPNATL